MKGPVRAILGAVAGVLLVSGAAWGESKVNLTLWTLWSSDNEPQKVIMGDTMKQWARENPAVAVEYDTVDEQTYKTKIRTAMAADSAPDAFFAWGGGFTKPFVEANQVLALDSYIDKAGLQGKLSDGCTTNFIYNGKTYALPGYQAVAMFYCNKDLFDKYRIKMPTTYDELVTAVKAFRAKGVTPITIGEKDKWHGMYWYDILAMRIAGSKMCQDALTKKISFDQPEFLDAAQKLDELVKLGAFNEGAVGLSIDEAIALFQAGKVPMFYNGTWYAGYFEAPESAVKGKIVPMKFPAVKGGKGNQDEFFGGCSDGFLISSKCDYKDQAFKLITMISENMSKRCASAGVGVPTWKVTLDKSKIDGLTLKNIEVLKGAKSYLLWWDMFLEGADADVHKDLLQAIYAQTITPQQYIAEMEKQLESTK